MAQPCEQADNIRNISDHLSDIKESLKEQTEIIRSVADQNARINALEKHDDQYQGNFTELFNRVRVVESDTKDSFNFVNKKIDRERTFRTWVTCKPAIAAYSFLVTLILVGAICDLVYHKETMDRLMTFLKG